MHFLKKKDYLFLPLIWYKIMTKIKWKKALKMIRSFKSKLNLNILLIFLVNSK